MEKISAESMLLRKPSEGVSVIFTKMSSVGSFTLLLRGTTLNRTYGTHKNLPGISVAVFTNNIWSYLLWSPVIVTFDRSWTNLVTDVCGG